MKTTEELLKERFVDDPPALPEGFEQRHDRLLHRLTTGKEEPYMRKQRMMRLALVVALALTLTGAALAAASQFGLFDLMRLYGHQQGDMAPAWKNAYEPRTFETDKVRVTVQELLSDGVSWYASVKLDQLDDGFVIMPSFVEAGDPVVGPLQPGLKAPPLTFTQLAQKDNRKLLQTSVYVEGTGEEVGFADHFGTEDGHITIVTGGYGDLPEKDFEASLRIITTQAQADGTLLEETRQDNSFPLTVPATGEKRVTTYLPESGDTSPLKEVLLTQTPLTTYADFVPASGRHRNVDYQLLDAEGNPYPPGFTLTGHAYKLDSLPDTIQVRITDYDADQQQSTAVFTRKP